MCVQASKIRDEILEGATYDEIAKSHSLFFKQIDDLLKEAFTTEEYEKIRKRLASNIRKKLNITEETIIFVLDTSFAIKNMSFVESSNSSIGRIIVPYDVIQELIGMAQSKDEQTGELSFFARTVERIGNQLYSLEKEKKIRIMPLVDERNHSYSLDGLSYFDQRILTMTAYYAEKSGMRVILLTNDGMLKQAALKYGIEAADTKEAERICSLLKNDEIVEPLCKKPDVTEMSKMSGEPLYQTYYKFMRFVGKFYSSPGVRVEEGKIVFHLDRLGRPKKLSAISAQQMTEGFLVEAGDIFVFLFSTGKVKVYRMGKLDITMRKYYNLSLIEMNKYLLSEKAWRGEWENTRIRDFLTPKMEELLKKFEKEEEAV